MSLASASPGHTSSQITVECVQWTSRHRVGALFETKKPQRPTDQRPFFSGTRHPKRRGTRSVHLFQWQPLRPGDSGDLLLLLSGGWGGAGSATRMSSALWMHAKLLLMKSNELCLLILPLFQKGFVGACGLNCCPATGKASVHPGILGPLGLRFGVTKGSDRMSS